MSSTLDQLDEALVTLRSLVETKAKAKSSEEKSILDAAESSLSRLSNASKWNGTELKKFMDQFEGFKPLKVLVGDANRDQYYGPYGISAAEHLTPKVDKGWESVGKSPSGEDVDASYKLFKTGNDYVLRFKILGMHAKQGKDPLRSVLWLFYIRKPAGGSDEGKSAKDEPSDSDKAKE